MIKLPDIYTLVAGHGQGTTPLVAFDQALLQAGVGNLNLLKVSSILPPGARHVEQIQIPPGSLVPIAYGSISSSTPGETIAAAVGIGITGPDYGVIMEFSGRVSRMQAEKTIESMVKEALSNRQLTPAEILIKAAEVKVSSTGCAFAGVVLWYA